MSSSSDVTTQPLEPDHRPAGVAGAESPSNPARPSLARSEASPAEQPSFDSLSLQTSAGAPLAGHTVPASDAAALVTHVVEVPADTSAASLRQLLLQFDGGRVILAVGRPAGRNGNGSGSRSPAPMETGLVQLQILRRQAEAQGIQVALVTRDGRLRQQATDAGLPVFSSVQGAQENTWRMAPSALDYRPPSAHRDPHDSISQRRRSRLAARFRRVRLEEGSPKGLSPVLEMVLLAALLVAGVVALTSVLAFIVPQASVSMVPAQQPFAETITVRARSDVEAADYATLTIPARRIGQRVEADGSIQATGSRSAPDQPAQGSVVFSNRTPQDVEVPSGTIVSTSTGSNVRFETLEPTLVPAGLGGQVTVPVRALEPGPSGNVPAFTINTVEGPLGVSLNVTNPGATGGGTVKQVATINQADKDRLRDQVLQQATQKAYLALGELLDEGEFVPSETVGTIVVDETYDRFTDEEAGEVTLRLRLLVTGLAVDGKAADEMALRSLGDRLPRRSRLAADSVTYTRGPVTVAEDGEAVDISFDNTASAIVTLNIDPAAVRAAIRGRTPAEAVDQLTTNWRLQSPPELTLGPEWLLPVLRQLDFGWLPVPVADRVPWLPFRTRVKVDFEG